MKHKNTIIITVLLLEIIAVAAVASIPQIRKANLSELIIFIGLAKIVVIALAYMHLKELDYEEQSVFVFSSYNTAFEAACEELGLNIQDKELVLSVRRDCDEYGSYLFVRDVMRSINSNKYYYNEKSQNVWVDPQKTAFSSKIRSTI